MIKTINIFLLLQLSINIFCQQTIATAKESKQNDYDIQDSVMIRTRDGASISAIVVRKKGDQTPQPVILQFTIYVRDKGRDIQTTKESVNHGYVGVIAYTRGKRFSPDEIYPYEHDGDDTYDVIDWISKQSWCNGSVGMFGGSYNGFTQWAACKKMHPALKTIVPYVANRPGMGLPMENNVFVNPNYEWSFYVGNNKYLDTLAGNDRKRFRKMQFDWWYSGAAYQKLDSIDGVPNRLFQRWISHPSFDTYWQKMAPYGQQFAKIKIPVLAFDGYYNDSQTSGLYYLREHQKYNPEIPLYLIIGPYGHFGAQIGGEKVLNEYPIDSVALIDVKKITYQWFEYILKNGKKPEILNDYINFEVMGENVWRSAPSLQKMNNDYLTLYLTDQKTGKFQIASSKKPKKLKYLTQEVDFKDRENSNNNYYPYPIIRPQADTSNGFIFMSDPIMESMIVNGSFIGQIYAAINKKDMDIGITLYEVLPSGEYFHLSYHIGRASYADDITKRTLLKPNVKTGISFSDTRMLSKKLSKGSRLAIYLNINKNPFSQLNYGTGKDVSTENIDDARQPLKVKWYNDSFVKIPILRL